LTAVSRQRTNVFRRFLSKHTPGLAPAGALLAWAAALLFLLGCFGCYLACAYWTITYPFGLDYAEGEVWRQARLIPGKLMYGDIARYPWIGFEYPPVFYLLANAADHVTRNFLQAGRAVSCGAALVSSGLVGWLAWRSASADRPTRYAPAIAALVAALMVFTLIPVVAFSTLVHVDMLGAMFSIAGVALAAAAFRRPALLTPAVFACVAAVFTKQTCIAAPLAILLVWGLRDPWRTARAFAAGFVTGLAALAWLVWQTDGGFLRHTFLYLAVNRWELRNFLVLAGNVANDCAIALDLGVVAVVLQWAWLAEHTALAGARDALRRLRGNSTVPLTALLTAYLVFAAAFTALSGKNGASTNYFLEALLACCLWTGLLVPLQLRALARLPAGKPWRQAGLILALPAALVFSARNIPAALAGHTAALYGPALRDQISLLAAVRATSKPVLSDDLALVLVAGKDAPTEPFLFAELARAGLWDETKLLDMLNRHDFGAVITYHDPGDKTFDGRFLPRTAAAILANYPRVMIYGEYRLRLQK
jgi:hypothetical protein